MNVLFSYSIAENSQMKVKLKAVLLASIVLALAAMTAVRADLIGGIEWQYRIIEYDDGTRGASINVEYAWMGRIWDANGEINVPARLGGYPVTDVSLSDQFSIDEEYADKITAVNLPNTIRTLWIEDFVNVKQIVVPESVEELTLWGLRGLAQLSIPASTTYVRLVGDFDSLKRVVDRQTR